MPKKNFTAKWVESVKPPPKGQVDYFDSSGSGKGRSFGLRVSYGGRKTFFVMYRALDPAKGRMILRRKNIGTFGKHAPALSLADARERADAIVAAVIGRQDPVAEDRARREAETFRELARLYLEDVQTPTSKNYKRSWKKDQQVLNRDVVPEIGHLKAIDVERKDVRQLLRRIVDRGSPIMANRTLALLSYVFNWAIDHDDALAVPIRSNPCAGIKKPAAENSRQRVLTPTEIRALWDALGSDKAEDDGLPDGWPSRSVRRAVALCLLTAQRRQEVAGAAKAEFDLDDGWWTIPAERSKNGRAHRVPLTPWAQLIVAELVEKAGDESHWLLPSPRGKGADPIDEHALTRAVTRIRAHLDIPHWTLHDLRRTAASGMASARVPRLVIGQVLNHAERGVTAVYDRHSYDAEKRQALDAWSHRLQEIVAGKVKDPEIVALGS